MSGFFTRERFGQPQFLAALMLFAFLAQCLWLVEQGWRTGTVYPDEIYRLEQGTAPLKPPGMLSLTPDLPPGLAKGLNPPTPGALPASGHEDGLVYAFQF